MSKPFTLHKFTNMDKDVCISGPELEIRVDFDDVDQKETLKAMYKLVNVLNTYWENYGTHCKN